MDYQAIEQLALTACLAQIKEAELNKDRSPERQAKVYTAGIVAALQEYDRQKSE